MSVRVSPIRARLADATVRLVARRIDAGACLNPSQPCIYGYQYKCDNGIKYRREIKGWTSCAGPCQRDGEFGPWYRYGTC